MYFSILKLVYPKPEIYIKDAIFNAKNLAIRVSCLVPLSEHYTINPIPYVTTENYVRCLSQSSYILGYYIIKNNLIPIDISLNSFKQAVKEFELYYRNLSMTFHKRVKRDEIFQMELILKNFKEIKRLQDFILFTFTNKRTVISGEMSFVFINQ